MKLRRVRRTEHVECMRNFSCKIGIFVAGLRKTMKYFRIDVAVWIRTGHVPNTCRKSYLLDEAGADGMIILKFILK